MNITHRTYLAVLRIAARGALEALDEAIAAAVNDNFNGAWTQEGYDRWDKARHDLEQALDITTPETVAALRGAAKEAPE